MKWIQAYCSKRFLLVSMLAGSGLLAASLYALTRQDPAGKPVCETGQGQNGRGEWEARRAVRMAKLKEKLKLVPGQEAEWDKFAEASRPGPRHMGLELETMQDASENLNTVQRLDRMLAIAEMRRARMVGRVEAIKHFYAQLSPEQQSVFDAEAILERNRGRHHPLQPW
jgi:hypothetical protein